jgi:hypothetical protein
VLALVAGATVVLAGLGWALVRAPGDVAAPSASVLVRPRAAASLAPTPLPTGAGDPGAVAADAVPGRDPFGSDAAVAATAQQPPDAMAPDTLATSPGISPDAAPVVPPVIPTGSPGGVPAVTHTAAPTVPPTVTVTTTAPGSAVYVGFYAWNGDRASFRVNARTYSYPVGSTFGPQLTFTSIRSGTPRCAVLKYQGRAFTLCPGQVVRLP